MNRAYADVVFERATREMQDALRREESMTSLCWRPTTLYARGPKIAPDAKKLLDRAVWSGRRRGPRL